jgi:hypothetical protein
VEGWKGLRGKKIPIALRTWRSRWEGGGGEEERIEEVAEESQ